MRYLRRARIRRPSAGVIIGMVALVVALGSNAQALPGSNLIFSDDIVDGQVRTQDINTDAVRRPDIRANAVGTDEIDANAVTGSELAANSVATSELAADAVRSDDMGPITSRQQIITLNPGQANFVIASCNAGEIVISGGASVAPVNDPDVALTASFRQSLTNWEAAGVNNDTVAHDLVATALCLEQ